MIKANKFYKYNKTNVSNASIDSAASRTSVTSVTSTSATASSPHKLPPYRVRMSDCSDTYSPIAFLLRTECTRNAHWSSSDVVPPRRPPVSSIEVVDLVEPAPFAPKASTKDPC